MTHAAGLDTRPRMPLLFAAISVLSHANALLVFGAVFWIDALAYGGLGEAIGTHGLRAFYDGLGTWFYSHLQPGMPLVWLLLEPLPIAMQWPVLAVVQHAAAAYALYRFFTALHAHWPSRWNAVSCALIACLPFYQAAHNSFMTESLSSTLLLLGLATALDMRREPSRARMVVLAALVIAVTQFRGYLGLLLAIGSIVLAFRTDRGWWRLPVVLAVAYGSAAFAYPAYRALETGRLWLPQLGLNKLQAAWWSNPRPSDEALRGLEQLSFPRGLQPRQTVDKGLDHEQALQVAQHWRAAGLDDLAVNRRAEAAGALLLRDGARVRVNQARLALTSSGFTLAYCAMPADEIVFPGYTAQRLCAHMGATYRFQSWTGGGNPTRLLASFFGPPSPAFPMAFGAEVARRLDAQTRPWISTTSFEARDPLALGKVAPDWLAGFALLGALAGLFTRWRAFALACLAIVACNAAVNFAVPVGNPRYGYFLFPLYAACAGLAAMQLQAAMRRVLAAGR